MSTERVCSEEIIQQLPCALQRLASFERFNLHRVDLFQNLSADPNFDKSYLPQNSGAFHLPCFWVRRKYLYVYGKQRQGTAELGLFQGCGLDEKVIFPIHPTSLSQYSRFLSDVGAEDVSNEGLRVWAVPTSSVRTLIAWPDGAPEKAMFVKTSLHSPILGDRRLCLRKVGCSVGLSRVVQESRESLPEILDFCWESVGYVPRHMPDSGVIIRSIPQAFTDNGILVAPMFALFGGSENHSPLFLTMLERNSAEAREFLDEVVCAQFARLWLEMTMRHGLILESHAQDLLVALTRQSLSFKKFFYRDFEGLQVDWELRRRRKFADSTSLPHAWSWYETYETWGYRYANLMFYKLMTSLDQYLYFVLREFDLVLQQWREHGLASNALFEKDEVTIAFSRHMANAAHELFGVRPTPAQSIHRSLKQFVIRLMKLRRELID